MFSGLRFQHWRSKGLNIGNPMIWRREWWALVGGGWGLERRSKFLLRIPQRTAFSTAMRMAEWEPRFCFCPTTVTRRAVQSHSSSVVSLVLSRTFEISVIISERKFSFITVLKEISVSQNVWGKTVGSWNPQEGFGCHQGSSQWSYVWL